MLKKALLTLTCIAMATSALAKEVTIPTARGDVTLSAPPAKIAVFDTGSLDTLQALGVKVDGAADVAKLPSVSETNLRFGKKMSVLFFEPNLEALNELKPDLIIVGTRTAKKFDDVSAIAKRSI